MYDSKSQIIKSMLNEIETKLKSMDLLIKFKQVNQQIITKITLIGQSI